MRRRPTRAAAAVVAAGVGLVLMSGPAQASWLAVVGALVLGIALGSVTVRHRLHHAAVTVRLPERARVGDPVRVELTVTAPDHGLPLHRLTLSEGPFAGLAMLVEPLRRRSSSRSVVEVTAATRGVHLRHPARLHSGAPFGLLRSSVDLSLECRVDVGAALVDVPAHLLRAVTGATDVAAERRRGGGDEVHAVRDYRSGDAMRDVHWRSTARAGRLVVKEYERPVPTRSAVAVVGGAAGEEFEALVCAAASVAHGWWRAGEPVDVVRVGSDGAPVVLRGASQHGLHDWSAAVEPMPGDLRSVSRALLEEMRPTTVVLALGPGAQRVADSCMDLLTAGCTVLVLTSPGLVEPIPGGVVHRVLRPGDDIAVALVGSAS